MMNKEQELAIYFDDGNKNYIQLLPKKIIQMVFQFLYKNHDGLLNYKDILSFREVCRSWNEVFLGFNFIANIDKELLKKDDVVKIVRMKYSYKKPSFIREICYKEGMEGKTEVVTKTHNNPSVVSTYNLLSKIPTPKSSGYYLSPFMGTSMMKSYIKFFLEHGPSIIINKKHVDRLRGSRLTKDPFMRKVLQIAESKGNEEALKYFNENDSKGLDVSVHGIG